MCKYNVFSWNSQILGKAKLSWLVDLSLTLYVNQSKSFTCHSVAIIKTKRMSRLLLQWSLTFRRYMKFNIPYPKIFKFLKSWHIFIKSCLLTLHNTKLTFRMSNIPHNHISRVKNIKSQVSLHLLLFCTFRLWVEDYMQVIP